MRSFNLKHFIIYLNNGLWGTYVQIATILEMTFFKFDLVNNCKNNISRNFNYQKKKSLLAKSNVMTCIVYILLEELLCLGILC